MSIELHDQVLIALRDFLQAELGPDIKVQIGWINEIASAKPATLTLEAGNSTDNTTWPGTIIDHSHPDHESPAPRTNVIVEYGLEKFPISANLWIKPQTTANPNNPNPIPLDRQTFQQTIPTTTRPLPGKTARSHWLEEIKRAFAPDAPGANDQLILPLNDETGNSATITRNPPRNQDTPDAVARDEWRAIITFNVRVPLRAIAQTNYARTLNLTINDKQTTLT